MWRPTAPFPLETVKMEVEDDLLPGLHTAQAPATAPAIGTAPAVAQPAPPAPPFFAQAPEHTATRAAAPVEKEQKYDDSDTDSLSSASSSIAEQAVAMTTVNTGNWDAESGSIAMKQLVAKREEIFQAQRKARHVHQPASLARVELAFGSNTTTNGPYLSGFRNYDAFCTRMDVPAFPITFAMVALWLFEKCSTRDGYFHTYKHGIQLAADVVESLWKAEPIYRTMRDYDRDGTALSEFMTERRDSYQSFYSKRAPAHIAKSPAKAGKAPPKSPAKQTHNSSDMDISSSSSSDNAHSEYASDAEQEAEADDLESDVEVADVRPIAVPGLPTRNSVFDSIVDVYKAYVAAIVPVYGISVVAQSPAQNKVHIKCNCYHGYYARVPGGICSWEAVCRRRPDRKWTVDFDASTFEHSHGPCKKILADPTYRPVMRNPDAREVLGLPPMPGQARPKILEEPDPQPVKKKPRLLAPAPAGSQMPPPPVPIRKPSSSVRMQLPSIAITPRPPAKTAQQQSYPSPISPSATHTFSSHKPQSAPAAINKPVATVGASANGINSPRVSSPLATPARSHVGAPSHPAPHPQPHPQLAQKPAPTPAPAALDKDDPVQLVTAFCAGLHPSLVTLAQSLIAVDVTSFDSLVALRCLDHKQFDRFLILLRKEHADRCAKTPTLPPLSNVHVLLFAKFMKALRIATKRQPRTELAVSPHSVTYRSFHVLGCPSLSERISSKMAAVVVFPIGKPVRWSLESTPASLRAIFNDREKLFALQRKLDKPNLQKQAEQLVRAHKRGRRQEIDVYRRFCDAVGVPPWPVTEALQALCVIAKLGCGGRGYSALCRELTQLEDLTREVFQYESAYLQLVILDVPPISVFAPKRTVHDSEASGASNSELSEREDDDSELSELEDNCVPTTQVATTAGEVSSADITFATLDEALVACALPIIKELGWSAYIEKTKNSKTAAIYCNRHNSMYNPICPFHWLLAFDKAQKRWVLKPLKSNLKHNHGADRRLLADPNWLPKLQHPALKKALETLEEPPHTGQKRKAPVTSADELKNADAASMKSRQTPTASTSGSAEKRPRLEVQITQQPADAPDQTPSTEPFTSNKPEDNSNALLVTAFFAAAASELLPLADAFEDEGLCTRDALRDFACLTPTLRAAFIDAVKDKYRFDPHV
ncbi:hypothetical protein JCM10908_000817 [Rhodotorula pacifica]|uniref:uncharacterized protein n=1 Tax=Rhodotorula pacifica TaxID=1495444 RepID=UPI00316C8B40